VTQDTEISRNTFSNDPTKPASPEKLSFNDLKKDLQVTVYSDTDITTATEVKALRIEPFMQPSTQPLAPPSANSGTTPPALSTPSAETAIPINALR